MGLPAGGTEHLTQHKADNMKCSLTLLTLQTQRGNHNRRLVATRGVQITCTIYNGNRGPQKNRPQIYYRYISATNAACLSRLCQPSIECQRRTNITQNRTSKMAKTAITPTR